MDTISILWGFCLIFDLLLKLVPVADHQRLRFVFLANLRKIQIVLSDWERDRWSSGSFGQGQSELREAKAVHSACISLQRIWSLLFMLHYLLVSASMVMPPKLGTHEAQNRRTRNCLAMRRFKNPLAYCWDTRLYEMINLGCRKRSLGQFSFRA